MAEREKRLRDTPTGKTRKKPHKWPWQRPPPAPVRA